ncbi:MAG: hypothetical protein C7B45_10775 [Sulfobacillus acidophilus]|uniref:YjbQ family protein n=1 Tax=Sulfobacillus acidophilus TaxID=53633 RepID=A0A2T2WGQ9_9FIRM|nr:MAG: hypothetical protein C7B45_10775 [Sulfobacillus acidophilus]
MMEFIIQTQQRDELQEITSLVQSAVSQSRVREGIVVVQSPHTTLAITANEHVDADVARDLIGHLKDLVPQKSTFRHRENNSDSHIKVSLVGPSLSLIVRDGQICLGTWQGIFACEFDGPRQRRIWVEVVGRY